MGRPRKVTHNQEITAFVRDGKLIKKRKVFSLKDKLNIIQKVESGERMAAVARSLSVNESTVRTMCKSKDAIKKAVEEQSPRAASNIVKVSHNPFVPQMEKALFVWQQDCYRKDVSVTMPVIQSTARDIYKNLLEKAGVDPATYNFDASRGWLQKYRRRFSVDNRAVSGESASADKEAAQAFIPVLQDIIKVGGYTPGQIFNADETAIFWKMMPKRSYLAKEQAALPGHKVAKQRVSLLFCSNVSGDCKPKPVCLHTSAHPRAFKNVSVNTLPVLWRSNKKAWMTKTIFEDWFLHHFCPTVQRYCASKNLSHKALLILDNCTGHPTNLNDLQEHVKVIFFPPRTTSLIQPLDQDIMCCVKAKYLELTFAQLHRTLASNAELAVSQYWKRFNILDCVRFIGQSWDAMTPNVLRRGWKKLLPEEVPDFAGFTREDAVQAVVASARSLPGEGFADITPDDINEILDAPTQPLTAEDAIEAAEEDLSASGNNASPDLDDEERPSFTLSTSSLTKIMQMAQHLQDLISESDPNFQLAEEAKSLVDKAVKRYTDAYKERQMCARQPAITSFFRAASTPPEEEPQPSTSGISAPSPVSSGAPSPLQRSPVPVPRRLSTTSTLLLEDESDPDSPPIHNIEDEFEGFRGESQ